MAKPIPKKRPKTSAKAIARGKSKWFPKVSTAIIGIDISMSSVAWAGVSYDRTLRKFKGPGFTSWRWQKNTDYFHRIQDVANPEIFIQYLFDEIHAFGVPRHEIYIAVEEPWPLGMVGRAQSAFLKQQAEISGALLGGLLRAGIKNIYQIQANQWRQIVAAELDITIHHSKWKDPELSEIYNCKPTDTGKFRAKQWALEYLPTAKRYRNYAEIPDWPDIIETKDGKAPRPEGSIAKAVQPDDRYDALAIMEWMHREWERGQK